MPIIESPTIPTAAEALTPASPARAPVEVAAIHPLRGRPRVRDWLQRDLLTPGDLIAPLLVQPDDRARSDWPALPTVAPAGGVGVAAAELWSLGVQAVKLFCHVTDKRPDGSAALEPGNPMVAAIRAVRAAVPDMVIATEVCGCAWTTTGECVVVDDRANTALDATYRLMADMAVLHAQAGADIIGPAAVLDGSIAAIRSSLDAAGHRNVGLTPSVIFHSVLFGPYKDGMGTNPGRGHRRGLQIDGCHIGQALDCAHRWLAEGADSLLVQPAMTSVDLLTRLRAQTNVPITAFSVSGEHELLGGHTARYVEYTQMLRRAGADRVMTYGAAQLAAAVATPVAVAMNDVPAHVPALAREAQRRAGEVGFEMASDDRTGALLHTLAASKPGGRILEIGTGVGVGAAWLLAGMDPTAHLVTIEVDPARAGVAAELLGDDPRATVLVDDAARWLDAYDGPPFDLAFVDWRVGKFEHRDVLVGHLAPGGLYVGDDLLPQPTWPDDHGPRVERFLAEIVEEGDLAVTLMNWASGLVVAARRHPAS